MKFEEITEARFEKFAKTCKVRNFYQSLEMLDRYKKTGTEAYLVGLTKGTKMVAAALVFTRHQIFGQKIFESARGFLMDYQSKDAEQIFTTMCKETAKFCREKGGMSLMIIPNVSHVVETDEKGKIIDKTKYSQLSKAELEKVPGGMIMRVAPKNGYKMLGEFGIGKWMYTFPIVTRKPDEIFHSFRMGHRRMIKYATERYGVRLRVLQRDELGVIKDIVHKTGARRGFGEPELSYYEEMYDAHGDKVEFVVVEAPKAVIEAYKLGDKEAIEKVRVEAREKLGDKVWIKRQDKVEMVPIAVGMFTLWDNEVSYIYGGSETEYKKFGGPHLMQFEMIKKAAKMGAEKYNFYGMVPMPGDGVYEFKRGFNGQLEEYVGAFIKPLTLLGRVFVARRTYEEIRHVE